MYDWKIYIYVADLEKIFQASRNYLLVEKPLKKWQTLGIKNGEKHVVHVVIFHEHINMFLYGYKCKNYYFKYHRTYDLSKKQYRKVINSRNETLRSFEWQEDTIKQNWQAEDMRRAKEASILYYINFQFLQIIFCSLS